MDRIKAWGYLELAKARALNFSKDTSTQVGAVIVGPYGEDRSSGYNGAPRGCAADEPDDSRGERPEKYFWFSHAEINAITNAARVGTPLDGCVMIVTHPPCMDCSRAIVQAGIKQVFAARPSDDFVSRWAEHMARARRLFDECGVLYEEL